MTLSSMAPTISVVIPAFNAEAYVAETLESVLAQTYRDFEIILVDDGSTDQTAAVVQSFGGSIRYIRTDNRGPSHARNTGIRAAKGQYIAFLDADDLWVPEKLALQVDFLQNRPHIGLVFGDMLTFNQDGVDLRSYFASIKDSAIREKLSTESDCISEVTDVLFQCNIIPTGTVVVRKDCLERSKLFDETISSVEDLDLWIRISFFCGIGCIPRVLKKKREHDSNISRDNRKALEAAIYIFEKYPREWQSLDRRYRHHCTRRLGKENRSLGYYFFERNDLAEARRCYWKSLKFRLSAEAVLYGLAACLPLAFVQRLRRFKALIA